MRQFEGSRRGTQDLRPEERGLLAAADQRLRQAVAAYESLLGGELETKQELKGHAAPEIVRSQEEIQAAEEELWHRREELLGWARPAWAPRASAVADWFSEEDKVYDDLEVPAPS